MTPDIVLPHTFQEAVIALQKLGLKARTTARGLMGGQKSEWVGKILLFTGIVFRIECHHNYTASWSLLNNADDVEKSFKRLSEAVDWICKSVPVVESETTTQQTPELSLRQMVIELGRYSYHYDLVDSITEAYGKKNGLSSEWADREMLYDIVSEHLSYVPIDELEAIPDKAFDLIDWEALEEFLIIQSVHTS